MTKSTKLILGTVQFGLNYGINNTIGKVSQEQVFEILDVAQQNGINSLDTAAAYGNAEELIGQYHSTAGKKPFSIFTKFHCEGVEQTSQKVQSALKKLKVAHVEVMMFHSFADYKKNPEVLNDLVKEKEAGRIKKIGVSVYTNDQIDELSNEPQIDVVQAPFNMLDNVQQRSSSFQKLKNAGKDIHSRSAFLQGLFFKDLGSLPEKLLPIKDDLLKLKELQNQYKIPMHCMALAYVLTQENIDGVLIGVDSTAQLLSNFEASNIELAGALLNSIDGIIAKSAELLNPANWKL